MSKIRVPIAGTIGKSVRINPDATDGAQVGVNLFDSDGNLVTALAALDPTEAAVFDFADSIVNWNRAYGWGNHALAGYLKNIVEDTTPQLGGNLGANGFNISMADGDINRPVIEDYGVKHQVATVSANAVTADCTLGNSVYIDMDPATAAVALTLSNPPASGTYGELSLIIQMGTPAWGITWPGSITWQGGGAAPTLTTVNNLVDVVHLFTVDGGTTWYGTAATASGFDLSIYTVRSDDEVVDGNWTFSNGLNMTDSDLSRPVIEDYGVKHQVATVSANAVTANCTLGNSVYIDMDPATADVVLTLSNPPASGTYGELSLLIEMGTPAWDITWPGSITWQGGGVAPTLSTIDNVVDVVHLFTIDGGTTWYGTAATATGIDLSAYTQRAVDEVITGSWTFPQINFDVAAGVSVLTGQMAWNADAGTMDIGMLGADVVLQVGQEMHFHAKAAEAMADGQVVYASGAVGASGKVEVSLFTGDGTVPAHVVMGVTTEAIAYGEFGYVTQFGSVRGLDTTGQGGETWIIGDILYPSPTVAGGLTNIKPVAPEIAMPIAFIVNVHANNGSIIVRPTPPHTLAELNDVHIETAVDGEILVYNAADVHWDNQTLAEAGISPLGHLHTGVYLPLAGGTMAGTLAMADNVVSRPAITDYGVTHQVATVSANAVTANCTLGNSVYIDMDPATADVALTLSNPPASGTYGELSLIIQMGTPAHDMTWPGSITWQGGSAPTLTTVNNLVDIVHLFTVDGGTTWYGTAATAASGLNTADWDTAFGWGDSEESVIVTNWNQTLTDNYNRIIAGGFQASNRPSASNWTSGMQFQHGVTGYASQLAMGTELIPELWIRNMRASSWGSWETVFLNRSSGGTLTGSLSIAEGPMDVTGSSDVNAVLTATNTFPSHTTGGAGFRLRHNDGAAMGSGHRLGFLIFAGAYDGSDNFGYQSLIEAYATEAWSSGNRGSDLRFTVTPNGSSARATELTVSSTGVDVVHDITAANLNVANWDTAYGWGNHASAGYLANVVEDTSPQLGGALGANGFGINMADMVLSRPAITDYGVTHQTATVSGNAVTANCTLGNSVYIDMDPATADVALTLSNPPASGTYGELSLIIQMGTPAHDMTWPGSITWQGGSAPTLSTVNNIVDVVHLFTIDGGTTWYGTFATAAASGGGGGTWGSITGTLADQTDLQAELDLKAPIANPTFTAGVIAQAQATDNGVVGQFAFMDVLSSVGRFGSYDYDAAQWKDVTLQGAAVNIVGTSIAVDGATVSSSLIGNWNSAYGWGNHASGGYAIPATVVKRSAPVQFSTAGGGWYRVAKATGIAGRGSFDIHIYASGGSETPNFLRIKGHKDWATLGYFEYIYSSSNTHWTGVRIVDDTVSADTYVEVNFVAAETAHNIWSQDVGYDDRFIVESGSLVAHDAGDTVRTTQNLQNNTFHTQNAWTDGTLDVNGVATFTNATTLFGSSATQALLRQGTTTQSLAIAGGVSGSPAKISVYGGSHASLPAHAYYDALVHNFRTTAAATHTSIQASSFNYTGTTMNLSPTGNINCGAQLQVTSGKIFRILDGGNTDYATFSHGGVHFSTSFVNTDDWDISGLTGAVDISTASSGPHFQVRGGTAGSTIAKFVRDQGADTFVSISGSGGEPQILFDRANGANQWAMGVDTGNNFVIADSGLVNTNDMFKITSGGLTYLAGDTTGHFEPVTGGFGSVQVDGAQVGGFEGYNIAGRGVFMWHPTSERGGIYDDVNNRWVLQWNSANASSNEKLELYNGTGVKLTTESTGVTVTGTLTATTLNATSDSRLKENIATYYPTVLGFDAKRYDLIDGERDKIGYIAQDVQAFLPGAVCEADDGTLSLDYNMVLVAKIAELEARLEAGGL